MRGRTRQGTRSGALILRLRVLVIELGLHGGAVNVMTVENVLDLRCCAIVHVHALHVHVHSGHHHIALQFPNVQLVHCCHTVYLHNATDNHLNYIVLSSICTTHTERSL